MPEKLPGNPNYPPGVRERDVSPPEPRECEECGGSGKINDDTECKKCDGEGITYNE